MFRAFRKSEKGAVLVYVAVGMTALLAVVGLSFDLGRHYILQQELQKAADAAAAAGAFQINPGETNAKVKERVQSAVTGAAASTSGTPITTNSNKIGASGETGVVDIADVLILNTIPADDDAPLPTTESFPARYVSVTTQTRVNNNLFARLAGASPTVTLEANAVATRGSAICQITPLFICNPAEASGGAGADFVLADWLGKQVVAREHPSGQGGGGGGGGNDAAWFPGNFGFLDSAAFGNGAKELAEALASGNTPACFRNEVNATNTGAKNAVRSALNTRFDMYDQPFFNNEDDSDVFGPAENVRKGYTDDTTPLPNTANCASQADANDGTNYMGLPRDNAFDVDANGLDRFGNGIWDCGTYWAVNHGSSGTPAPTIRGTTCADGVDAADITRFEVYRYEIDNNLLANQSVGGENGQPLCNPTNAISPLGGELSRDRRIITMAVVDCVSAAAQQKLNGKVNIPVKNYINGFLTEPVAQQAGNTDYGEMVFEIVGIDTPGNANIAEVIARDWVEIVR